ncbi:YjgF-like protein [Aspergillus cavernicola]|uniref:YjgF-like protein n=1 Tax=Aspergillus cavernicola TaxID=176166 RepID=A0ABR4INP5_9EURO
MSYLQYYAYPGYGVNSGWDPSTSQIHTEINAQIDQAFANMQLALENGDGKGWSQVFRVNSYHLPLNDEALNAMTRNLRKNMTDHQPIWTCIGVSRLAFDDMRAEIEVVAHDEEDTRSMKGK